MLKTDTTHYITPCTIVDKPALGRDFIQLIEECKQVIYDVMSKYDIGQKMSVYYDDRTGLLMIELARGSICAMSWLNILAKALGAKRKQLGLKRQLIDIDFCVSDISGCLCIRIFGAFGVLDA